MKLSIIVPVYNMEKDGKLKYCLDSLISQQMDDYEIVAVDDKSTDRSLEILRQYEAQYPELFQIVVSEQNNRQGGAKNRGLAVAKGEWIGFMDSDDWASPYMFPKLLKKAEETGADVVGCDYLLTDQIGLEEGIAVENNTSEQCGLLDEEKYKKLVLKPGSMVVKIYRRALFEAHDIRFPEKMFYEDNAIGVLPLLYAKRFERVEECLYFYYQHSTSTVHTVDMNKLSDRVRTAQIYLEECKKRGFYKKYQKEMDYKVFELGYRNTLFSYLQSEKIPKYSFIRDMKHFLETNVPKYWENPYYQQYMDAENKKLIALHTKSPLLFLVYYEMLKWYRSVRYATIQKRESSEEV